MVPNVWTTSHAQSMKARHASFQLTLAVYYVRNDENGDLSAWRLKALVVDRRVVTRQILLRLPSE